MSRFVTFIFLVGLAFILTGGATPSLEPSPTSPLPIRYQGQPIKGSGPAVYRVMEDGTMRHIRDLTTFFAWGYQWGDVVTVADATLADYPLASPLSPWITGFKDGRLYFLDQGRRYVIPDAATLQFTGGTARDVTQIPEALLNQFPLMTEALPAAAALKPTITAGVWWKGGLWAGDSAGNLRRYGDTPIHFSTAPVYTLLATDADLLMGGAGLWRFDGQHITLITESFGYIAGMAFDSEGYLWVVDVNHYDRAAGRYHHGAGLIQLDLTTGQVRARYDALPFREGTAITFDRATNTVWLGTTYTGYIRLDLSRGDYQMVDNVHIHDIITDPALGQLWLASYNEMWRIPDDASPNPMRYGFGAEGLGNLNAIALGKGVVWGAGDQYLAALSSDGTPTLFRPSDSFYFLDQFMDVVIDSTGAPWWIGQRHHLHIADGAWLAIDVGTGESISFNPAEPTLSPMVEFPSPTADYAAWLARWERPRNDNGRCIHFVQSLSGDSFEVWKHIARLERLEMRWVLVVYKSHAHLAQLAPIFAQTDIMVIWRPFVRPFEAYPDWAADVALLRELGLPPYLQLYNEPSHPQEWEGQPINQALYLENLTAAIQAVYAAGGYIGLQHLDLEWLRATLQHLKAAGLPFDRTFYIPHPYGVNHPPDFSEDQHGVLGFRDFAAVWKSEMGYVPMMVAGEGGWRLGDGADTRYPAITEATHRDYHLAVFDWFRTGVLSDGAPLPDYLFAFCPWLLSDAHDPAAWFDHPDGDRSLTIEALEAIGAMERPAPPR